MKKSKSKKIVGRLLIQVRDAQGTILTERKESNTVVRMGAELIASLFTGVGVTPINGMQVGINSDPSVPPYEIGEVTTMLPDETIVIEKSASLLNAESMAVEVLPEEFLVRVSVSAVIPADHVVSPDPEVNRVLIGEAALGVLTPENDRLAQLYNRVVFEPIPKTRNQELALYWEVDFPYGM